MPRKQQFDELPKLATSMIRALKAYGVSEEKMADARQYLVSINHDEEITIFPMPAIRNLIIKTQIHH